MRTITNIQLRKRRTRAKITGTAARPRLSVFRSNRFTYGQLIDDDARKTLVSASTQEVKSKGNKSEVASQLGELLAQKAKKVGIETIVFDKGPYRYHGRVKNVAEAARKAGLKF